MPAHAKEIISCVFSSPWEPIRSYAVVGANGANGKGPPESGTQEPGTDAPDVGRQESPEPGTRPIGRIGVHARDAGRRLRVLPHAAEKDATGPHGACRCR